jgi:adenylate cyclase
MPPADTRVLTELAPRRAALASLMIRLVLGAWFLVVAGPARVSARPAADSAAEVRQLIEQAEGSVQNQAGKTVEQAARAVTMAEQAGLAREASRARLVQAKGYYATGAYDMAFEKCQQALQGFERLADAGGQADALEQLGYIYWKLGDKDRIGEYFSRSLKLRRETGDRKSLGNALNNVGIFTLHYLQQAETALGYYNQALEIARSTGDRLGEAHSLNNLGNFHLMQDNPAGALDFELQSLAIYRELKETRRVAVNLVVVGYIYQMQGDPGAARRHYDEALGLARQLGARSIERDIYRNYSELYESAGDELKHLQYYKQYAELKDNLAGAEMNRNLANLQTQFAVEKKELENHILKLSLDKQKIVLWSLAVLIVAGSVALYFIVREKRISERLLLNILPRRVAAELKRYGRSHPQTFPEVTVLFSDFAGFTRMSATMDPGELIGKLNDIFTDFDNLVEKFGCERIKTIGDAYLAVCGLPDHHPHHAKQMVRAALGMIACLMERNRTDPDPWQIRIGIHSGRVVGGIVGIKKYLYDVFGDTINTASRMETHSLPMRVNISEVVYDLVKDEFDCEARPEIEVKGKGRMRMFFVTGGGLDRDSQPLASPPAQTPCLIDAGSQVPP